MLQRKESRLAIGMEPNNALEEKTTVLQSALYQAAKASATRRFHHLYDKIYRIDVLLSAWRLVKDNGGSPGVDGVSIESIERLGETEFLLDLQQSLKDQTYRPQPARRVEIPKSDGSVRVLGIPTVRDRVAQAAVKLVIEPIFEADFLGTSYGFRPGIGQLDALASVERHAHSGFRWVVDADIRNFFDTLDHEQLMEGLRRRISDGAVLRLIYRWLKIGTLQGGVHTPSEQGTPQGGVLSPLLANIYLHKLDKANERQKSFIGHLVRFADDLVILCGNLGQAERALEWLHSQIEAIGLSLHPQKTRLVNDVEDGYDFLGFHHRRVRLEGRKHRPLGFLRWPRRKSCQNYRDKIKDILRKAGGIRTAKEWRPLRDRLNSFIRGYGDYFKHGHSTRVFHKLDQYTTERVARYLARQQPRGKKRRRVRWPEKARWLSQSRSLITLRSAAQWSANPYRGQANIRWKAV